MINIYSKITDINLRIMSDSMTKLIQKFKNHDPFRYKNKQNSHYQSFQCKKNNSNKEITLIEQIYSLEANIDNLVTDANCVIKFFQHTLADMSQKQQQTREQFATLRLSFEREKKQYELQIKQQQKNIQNLNSEINLKTIEYHELYMKYQQQRQKTNELRIQNEININDLQKVIENEQTKIESKLAETQQFVLRYKLQLIELNKVIENLEFQNEELKKITSSLYLAIQSNNQLACQSSAKSIITKDQKNADKDSLYSCQLIENCSDEDKFTFQYLRRNDSQQLNFNGQKEVLDISEHYSKFNRTDQFRSKEKQGQFTLIMNSNQLKPLKYYDEIDQSFIRKQVSREVHNNSAYVRISTIQSKDEGIRDNNNQIKIQQIQQFQMPSQRQESPQIDPYRAFFILLVQCEKLNSMTFQRGFDQDLTISYEWLIEKGIPYNKWQEEIRKNMNTFSQTKF